MSVKTRPGRNLQNLFAANTARSLEAAPRVSAQAREALAILRSRPKTELSERYIPVLWLRATYFESTLAELAFEAGMTKDAYAAMLRRAINLCGGVMSSKDFILHLARLRVRKGLTASEVAQHMNVIPPAVYMFESGTRAPRIDTVLRYASAIGVEIQVVP